MNFFKTELWTIRTDSKPFFVRKGLRALRIIILTVKMFLKNACPLQASALTFYTLLSIIPVLALGFAVAKGFGLEEKLEQWLYSVFDKYPEIADKLVEFASNTLNGAKGGVIAGVGAAVLLFTTVKLLMQIERAFNRIWGVQAARSWMRKISDYLSLVLLCPILIAVNGSMSAFAAAQLAGMNQSLPFLSGDLSFFLSRLIPFAATWFLFVFIYVFIPNTKVQFASAAFGGLVAALLYYLIQSVYITAQFLAAKYNAIYGGFAALPLFLVWLQVSWVIVLFGSEMVFAVQNVAEYEGLPLDSMELGNQLKAIYSLRIMRYCSIQFEYGKVPPSEEEITKNLEIPELGARQVLDELVDAHLVSRVIRTDRVEAFQVSLPTERLTAAFVLETLQNRKNEHLSGQDHAAAALLEDIWKDASANSSKLPLSKTLI